MNTNKLQAVLEEAQMFAKIIIQLNKFSPSESLERQQAAGDMILHFCNKGLLFLFEEDKSGVKIAFAKSNLFMKEDAQELAKQISEFVSSAEYRTIPDHTVTLSSNGHGWQVSLAGGNRLMRRVFAGLSKMSDSIYDFESKVVSDINGEILINLSEGSEEDVLQLSMELADYFKKELII